MQRGMYVQYLGRLEVRDICGGAVVWCGVLCLRCRCGSRPFPRGIAPPMLVNSSTSLVLNHDGDLDDRDAGGYFVRR